MMVMVFLLSSDITETGFNNTTRGEKWCKSSIQENLLYLVHFPSLPLSSNPSCSCFFYSAIWPETFGPGTDTSPNGESIYRPAEPILLPRAFTFGDRETESACWWMVIDRRSYGVRAGVSPSASWSHEVVNHRKQWREVGEQSQGRDPRQ